MIDMLMISKITKVGKDQIVEIGEISVDKILEVDQDINQITKVKILDVMQKCINISGDRTVEEKIGAITEMIVIAIIEVGVGLEKKKHFRETLITEE